MSLRIVFMGTPDFAVPSLCALVKEGYDVVGVFTQPDRPKGRGGKVQQSPVKTYALKQKIPVYQPQKIRIDGLEDLRNLAPDLCVTAAFGQILSREVLDIPRLGTVNVHGSLLPRHRGATPVQWAILQGDIETGVTSMLTDKGIDTGDILLKETCPIMPEDTAGSLLEKLSFLGAELLIETLARLEKGSCPKEKQEEALATYDPMLSKEMGLMNFEEGTQACLRKVRAMDPWPCAYAALFEGVLKIWKAKEADAFGNEMYPAGTILYADSKQGLIIATGDGALELMEIQAPNAKRLEAKAFLRGHEIEAGKPLHEVKI